MGYFQVILDPLDKVVLECALDDLMEKVGGEKLVNIRTWELHRERLQDMIGFMTKVPMR